MDSKVAGKKRLLQLTELEEFRNEAYENVRYTKRRQKLSMISTL